MPGAFDVSDLPRFAVMGVVNVTPDSFSDGGRFLDVETASAHARDLVADGAAIIDVGGESTRPGAEAVALQTELARVVPVIELLRDLDVIVSVDTTKAGVAEAALSAGAHLVNDVSAGLADGRMLDVVADADAGFLAMHRQGTPTTMQNRPTYGDVVEEVGEHLAVRVAAAVAAGIRPGAILADPGIGFGKTMDHNLRLLAALPALADRAGAPLVVGASRKSFLGAILDLEVAADRDDATLATSVWAFERGCRVVRVHDVAASVRVARFLDLLGRSTPEGVSEAA